MRPHLLLLPFCAAITAHAAPLPPFTTGPTLNGPVRELRLAAAPDGALVLAVASDDARVSSGRGTFVGRLLTAWQSTPPASTWTPLGDGTPLNYDRPRPVSSLNLALDARGTPVLVWNENYGDNDVVVMRAWRGGAWTDWRARYLGEDLTYAARTLSVAARSGEPVLAWGDTLRGGGSRLTIRTWDGRTWARGEPFNDVTRFSRAPALALDAAGRPVVAWLQGDVLASDVLAKRWTGATWEALGGPLNRTPSTYVAATRLALDTRGTPVVAWLEDVSGADTLRASRWNGRTWTPIGGDVSSPGAASPSLALDPSGRAVLAWVEERAGVGQVRLARERAGGWEQFGILNRDAARDARSPSVTADASGHVTVAWREDVGGTYRALLRRFPASP
ncbi:hypothetical protein [Deinococcus pimensis]|uniref:hypothetical protein n=1 Tax=Deinococcus pimensis TaxID=309888 RepID=UPI0004BC144C|nr:hypothetical protein [Deinococcus pimensis]